MMKVIGYYTEHTPYADEALALRRNLDAFAIEHDIRGVPNLGSWLANTSYKSRFVQEMLAASPGQPLVYLDVDAEILSPPTLLHDLAIQGSCDIAAAKFGGHELLSGTLYLGGTPKLDEVVAEWVALCTRYPKTFPGGLLNYHPHGSEAWDQRMLQLAINRVADVRFVELPPGYTFIHDLSRERYPDTNPVILHTCASRRYRDGINDGSLGKVPAAV